MDECSGRRSLAHLHRVQVTAAPSDQALLLSPPHNEHCSTRGHCRLQELQERHGTHEWCACCLGNHLYIKHFRLQRHVPRTLLYLATTRSAVGGGKRQGFDSNLRAVTGQEGGAAMSIPGNEGIIAQVWVNVRRGVRVIVVHFWHLEGWTPRYEALMEAVVKKARTARYPWLVACDANMHPKCLQEELVVQKQVHVH